jgi:hypothetical protein
MRRLEIFFILGFIILAFGTHAQKRSFSAGSKTFTAMKRSLLHQFILKDDNGMLSDSSGAFLFHLAMAFRYFGDNLRRLPAL